MLARFASEAFSRAIMSAPLGMSNEKIVNATPLDVNVPDVSVRRWNDRWAHAESDKHSAAGRRDSIARRRGFMRQNIAGPDRERKRGLGSGASIVAAHGYAGLDMPGDRDSERTLSEPEAFAHHAATFARLFDAGRGRS